MPEQEKASILMVDDEPNNLLALEAVLGKLGHNLVRADSGKEALRLVMKEDFALVLMDVQMPDMDGFETARIIHARDRSSHVPIIFLTAVGKTEQEIFKGYNSGAVDYILKPYSPEILRHKVSVLVELQLKTAQLRRQARELRQAKEHLGLANQALRRLVEELTVPVLQVHQGLLVLPVIGSLDEVRIGRLTKDLLAAVRDSRAEVVVLDITGVAQIDSYVARGLTRIFAAARLMGAKVLVTGVSEAIAASLVALGPEGFKGVPAFSSLRAGLERAFIELGLELARPMAAR